MSDSELRDELMTLLVAGHETTASELAWAFERLAREPAVLARLADEIDRDDGDDYLTATIHETLRRRPVLPNAAPRLVMQEIEVGGWTYPPGVCLIANAYLIHHDPEIYPDPYGLETWDQEVYGVLRVHIVNSEQFEAITGEPPPPTPVSAETYTHYGLPWFNLYDETRRSLPGSSTLGTVKSIGEKAREAAQGSGEPEPSVAIDPAQIKYLDPPRSAPSDEQQGDER